MIQTLAELERLTAPDGVSIWDHGEGGRGVSIATEAASASISLFGAQILKWQPRDHEDTLWLSNAAVFDQRTEIRGGIPICWPWFGRHSSQTDWPSHGFARTSVWLLDDITLQDGNIVVRMSLPKLDAQAPYGSQMTRPSVVYTIGDTLGIELSTTNVDTQPIDLSQALHTYFNVSEITEMSIAGLENSPYIDKLNNNREEPAEKMPITINAETDRIYRNLTGPIQFHHTVLNRTITITHEGASNAIVWNPWIEKSKRLGDMGPPDAYRGMVCIEIGNVAPDAIHLKPTETQTLKTTISVRHNS